MSNFWSMLKGLAGSRKWAIGILTTVILMFNKKIGLDLSTEDIAVIAGLVAAVILGEAHIDGKAAEGTEIPPGTKGE